MVKQNIFHGGSVQVQFANIIYTFIKRGEWFSYVDVMCEYLGRPELEYGISKCENYTELKKAFSDVIRAVQEVEGEDSVDIEGNKRNRRFRYKGGNDNPLAEMYNAKTIENLKEYWQFCQDSEGFFPISWLEYFFKDCRDLVDIHQKRRSGNRIVSASVDRIFTNIELLPMLYMAIRDRHVLEIEYQPYGEEAQTLIFHPHCLKEYNGRWHLFGHTEGGQPEYGHDLALDRIKGNPRVRYKLEYKEPPEQYYDDFFKNIVGVSHIKGEAVREVHIRINSLYYFRLNETKPLHPSQVVIKPFGEYKDGTYGEIKLSIEVNNEFFGRILQMGSGWEVTSPPEVREKIRLRIEDMVKLYNDN